MTQQVEPGLWTSDLSEGFYTKVNALAKELKEHESPRVPEDYRKAALKHTSSDEYALSYEEELHLADHFAFLAHVVESPDYVSATTLEELSEPPGFVLRLAANRTPKPYVVAQLRKILDIVQEHAEAGKDREIFKSRLLDEILSFSQQRIYGRIRTVQWKPPGRYHKSDHTPLHERIDQNLAGVWAPSARRSSEVAAVRAALIDLRDTLKRVNDGPPQDQLNLLKETIFKSYAVSNQGTSNSLEHHLKQIGLAERISQSREVLEIDKLSKYLQICNDFIRLSRQPRTRQHCKNFKLEVCEACPSTRPAGTLERCRVHGEVQLIIFYEEHKIGLPPRAIGSSKSACFLCDLFVRYHGDFGISHSHMKLYSKWTIPVCNWMDPQQRERYRDIIRSMTAELGGLLNKKIYHRNSAAESKAHILQIQQTSSIVSSALTVPAVEAQQRVASPRLLLRQGSNGSSQVCLLNDNSSSSFGDYQFENLPVTMLILPTTISCALITSMIEYVFDLQDVKVGKLCISTIDDRNDLATGKEFSVYTGDLDDIKPVCIRPKGEGARYLVFYIRNDEHSIRVEVSWDDP